jgi:hypothetical protein
MPVNMLTSNFSNKPLFISEKIVISTQQTSPTQDNNFFTILSTNTIKFWIHLKAHLNKDCTYVEQQM